MKAIVVTQPGGVEQLKLQEYAVPACGADEILVKIHAAGINYIDVYTRTGLYKPPAYPFIPGKEGSGTVIEVGNNVKAIKVGDRVAFCFAGSGSYAEVTAIPAERAVLIPEDISFETAAAAMLQGLTAYYLSHITFQLDTHHTALIHAGAGGVGLLLIQVAKLLGANVLTTVSTDDKATLAKKMGADEVILYTQESFLERTLQITNKVGVNVVYDSVGKTTFDDSLKALAVRGMLVAFGQSSGPIPPFELSRLSEKSLFLTRPSLGHYILTHKELTEMSQALFNLILSNKLQITIGHRYPLADAASAHADLEARKTVGKSILIVE